MASTYGLREQNIQWHATLLSVGFFWIITNIRLHVTVFCSILVMLERMVELDAPVLPSLTMTLFNVQEFVLLILHLWHFITKKPK